MGILTMRNFITAGIIILIIIAGGFFLYNRSTPNSQSMQQSATPTQGIKQEEKGITLNTTGFSPDTLTIKAGTLVTWTNKIGKIAQVDSNPHPVHTSYPLMNFDTFSDGSSISLVFDKPGTYHYHNHLNPSQTGTIVVE